MCEEDEKAVCCGSRQMRAATRLQVVARLGPRTDKEETRQDKTRRGCAQGKRYKISRYEAHLEKTKRPRADAVKEREGCKSVSVCLSVRLSDRLGVRRARECGSARWEHTRTVPVQRLLFSLKKWKSADRKHEVNQGARRELGRSRCAWTRAVSVRLDKASTLSEGGWRWESRG
jgi:hypothetical protein